MNMNNNLNNNNSDNKTNNNNNISGNNNGNNSLGGTFYHNNTTFCFSPVDFNEKDPVFSTHQQQRQQNISSTIQTPINFDNINSDEYLPFQSLTRTLSMEALSQMGNHDDLGYKNIFDQFNLLVDDKENENNNFIKFPNKNNKITSVMESESLNNQEKEPPNLFFNDSDLSNFLKGKEPVNNTINIANTDSILDFQPLVMEDNKNVHNTFLNLDFHEQNNIIDNSPKIKKKNINFSFLNLSKDLSFNNRNELITMTNNPIIKELKNSNQNNKYSMDQQFNLLKKKLLKQLEVYQNENVSQIKNEKEIKIILIIEELQKIKKEYKKKIHSINQAKNNYLNGVMNSSTPLEDLLQEKGGISKIEEKFDNLFLLLNQQMKKKINSILPNEMRTDKKEKEKEQEQEQEKQKENVNENENANENENENFNHNQNDNDHYHDSDVEYGKNQNKLSDSSEFGSRSKQKFNKEHLYITRKNSDGHLNNNILNRKRTRSKLYPEKNNQYLNPYNILINNDNKLKSKIKSNLKNKQKHKKKIKKSNKYKLETKSKKRHHKKMKKRYPDVEFNHKKRKKKLYKKKLNEKNEKKEKKKIKNKFKLQNEQENNHKLKLKRRRRSKRLRTTDFAKEIFEEWFQQHYQTKEGPYPEKETRLLLAEKTQIPELQVQRWFGQRRRMEKAKFKNNEIPKPHWL
ncbi:hypothetical protein M0813_28403 [Anaeramoeba flamelloides]|uniref:Homeobox domain-containing protein n=1 Tax=Anaeramoeba flamelloides TaxID=1746091 RepID=A0ABQ8XT99_9EUKA|nr:hypothetical protein M0813_28403 [Anaeramoeba flamelloides]